jgi:predicted amidohydrolase YtcJ
MRWFSLRGRGHTAGRGRLALAVVGLSVVVAGGCAGRLGRRSSPTPVIAELVLTNAVVYTLDPAAPWAEALAIADGKLLAVGSSAEALRHRGEATRVVDLNGQLVLPGFHDAHVHPVTGGIELGQCSLGGIGTLAALRAALRECAKAIGAVGDEHEGPPKKAIGAVGDEHEGPPKKAIGAVGDEPKRPWLVGGGWELTLFPHGNPSRQWLDEVVPGVPVFLTSADGHSSWLSSEGLRRAGITAQTPDPPNGRIERDAQGEPSGTLREDAAELVSPHLPPVSPAEHDEGLRRALAMANRLGITGMVEAAADAPVLAAYERLAHDGELTARVVVAQVVEPLAWPEQLAAIATRRDRIDHPRLRAHMIKIFVDGVIEAGTAALLQPYVGEATAGEATLSPAALIALIGRADALGLDVHVHAIGDRAVRMTLDAFEVARHDNPARVRRDVIAHLELVDPTDIPRFHGLGVAACFQPLWAYADPYITELTIPVLGPERERWLYPIGSVLASGAKVVAGSDWSVSSMDPLEGIAVAITRRGVGEPPGAAWIPEEVATLPQMLAAYTLHGAWLGRWDDVTGSLVVGKRADLAILGGNVFERAAHRLHEVDVVTTLLDGEVVYRGPGDRIGGG